MASVQQGRINVASIVSTLRGLEGVNKVVLFRTLAAS